MKCACTKCKYINHSGAGKLIQKGARYGNGKKEGKGTHHRKRKGKKYLAGSRKTQ
jgi:hypothetical protein